MIKRLTSKKIAIGIVLTLALLTVVGINYAVGVDGPKVKELSLKEAIDLALKNNPDIESANLSVQKAQVEYDGAVFSADRLDSDAIDRYDVGLVKWVSPKAKQVALTLAKKGKELAENKLRLSVETAYYDVLKSQRNLQIKRENLKYFQDQLKIAQTAYKIGTKAKVDVTVIEAAVASYQALVTNEENTYNAAVMELNRITGLDLNTPLKLTTQLSLEKISDKVKLEETVNKAVSNNFEILQAKQEAEVKKVQYDVAKKFYGGGSTIYDTAAIDIKSADVTVRKQELATTAVVKQSYLSLFTLEKMIDSKTMEVEKAKENARVFALKYEAGLATSLDVKKATIDLEQAQEDLSEAIFKYNLLKTQFKYDLFSTAGM